uniref:Uncharacterized protein n=1 Tax=Arundo donax TaxID=35708 RepID=A0A0A9FVW2_ARUDO
MNKETKKPKIGFSGSCTCYSTLQCATARELKPHQTHPNSFRIYMHTI